MMEYDYIKQGDCLELMKEIPNKSIDMVLCDLPYGTTSCSWDVIIPFEPLWEQYNRIVKDDGAIVLFGSQPFTSELIHSNIENFKYEWIWEKQKAANFILAKHQPLKYHENILVFGVGGKVKYFPQKYPVLEFEEIKNMTDKQLKLLFENRDYDRYGKIDRRKTVNDPITNKEHIGHSIKRTRSVDDGTRYPKSVIKINKSINKNIHPTEKSVQLCEYLIKSYTEENDIVLDNCIGSGSTCVASINTGRHYIGYELEPKYYEIAKKRIEETQRSEGELDG